MTLAAEFRLLIKIKVAADQRIEARLSERRHAMAIYQGALSPVVTELKEMPPNKEPDLVTKAIEQISGEQAAWVRTRNGLIAMSPHMFGRMACSVAWIDSPRPLPGPAA